MTVPAACTKIAEYIQTQIDAGVSNVSFRVEDIFPTSQDAEFVEELITTLKATIGNPDLTAHALIGSQEALAFFGSLQRIDKIRKSSRITRRARGLTHKDTLADTSAGALALQLSAIGSKVDSEHIADLG